jgi:glutamate-ammonia-ligase adenylyltransferase
MHSKDFPWILPNDCRYSKKQLQIFGELSPFLRQLWQRRPSLLDFLGSAAQKDWSLAGRWQQHYAQQESLSALRQLRQEAVQRLVIAALAKEHTWQETLKHLSADADFFIQTAYHLARNELKQRYGEAADKDGRICPFYILAMGKLGGGELNFSSDIDLILVYDHDGETQASDTQRSLTFQQFFTRLGQQLVKLLADITPDGQVYRVDLRLRPWGDSGPIVLSLDGLEQYYQTHGRDWERYAAIKARVVVGEAAPIAEVLRPFVYRRYFDYPALAALRDLKSLIDKEGKQQPDNLKIGGGGIREVEFVVQVFQLMRGGREKDLQSPSLLKILPLLVEKKHLPAYVGQELFTAYGFLRQSENFLQMQYDEQTHILPKKAEDQLRLAQAMGFAEWSTYYQILEQHRQRVRNHFEQVMAAPQTEDSAQPLRYFFDSQTAKAEVLAEIQTWPFSKPEKVFDLLARLKQSLYRKLSARSQELLSKLLPLLVGASAMAEADYREATLARLLEIIEKIARRQTYLAFLLEHPLALSQLTKICTASPWLAAEIAKHPVVLDELIGSMANFAPTPKALLQAQLPILLSGDDQEQQLENLRFIKHQQVLRIAVADLFGRLPVMKVSDALSDLAEALLEAAANRAWAEIASQQSEPENISVLIVAYGKLGGIELGYGSDLDLVFLYQADDPDSSLRFVLRWAQRCIHLLSTNTASGRVYEVDTRLRPHGEAGLLVQTFHAYGRYLEQEAWLWEKQALVRARVVYQRGKDLTEDFLACRSKTLTEAAQKEDVAKGVREMRRRQHQEFASKNPALFHLKHDYGGIADIEFLVQYAVLSFAATTPALLQYTDNIRLLATLAAADLLPAAMGEKLAVIYRRYRETLHRQDLQQAGSSVCASRFAEERQWVNQIWQDVLADHAADRQALFLKKTTGES